MALVAASVACQTPQATARSNGLQKLVQALNKPLAAGRLQRLEEAERLFAKAEAPKERAIALQWIAYAHEEADEHEAALKAYRESLRIYDGGRAVWSPQLVWLDIGKLELEVGNPKAAQAAYEQTWRMARESESLALEASAVTGLARVLAAQGSPEPARSRFQDALGFAVRSGAMYRIAEVHLAWGKFEAEQGNTNAAREHYEYALREREEALHQWAEQPDESGFANGWASSRQGATQILLAQAQLELDAGELDTAMQCVRRAELFLHPLPLQSPNEDDTAYNRKLKARLQQMQSQLQAARAAAPTRQRVAAPHNDRHSPNGERQPTPPQQALPAGALSEQTPPQKGE